MHLLGEFLKKGNLDSPIAVVEIDLEMWSNRLRVTEMWVRKDFRRQGLATILISLTSKLIF